MQKHAPKPSSSIGLQQNCAYDAYLRQGYTNYWHNALLLLVLSADCSWSCSWPHVSGRRLVLVLVELLWGFGGADISALPLGPSERERPLQKRAPHEALTALYEPALGYPCIVILQKA